jgi:hypothetical protein
MNFVVGVGLLEPQTANGSESFLTPSLAATTHQHQLPAQLRGRASIAFARALAGRQYANPKIRQQKTGGVVLSCAEAR